MTIDSADYESNLESDVRFEIESNHEASQVPTYNCLLLVKAHYYHFPEMDNVKYCLRQNKTTHSLIETKQYFHWFGLGQLFS